MTDFELIQQTLQSKGLAYLPGKGGVLVLPVEGGFRLVNLNQNGKPLHFNEKQIELFKITFPSLKEQLVVNAETRRRAESLIERQKNMASIHAESFDKDVPKMPALGQIDASNPSGIPKYYGMIDDVGGDNYIVSIFASELGIETPKGRKRPDEALLQFEVNKKDLDVKKLKNGELSLKKALENISAKNVRMIYFDDNNPIRGTTRIKHMSKTLQTLGVWVQFVVNDIKFNALGNIFVHAEDYYGLPTIEVTGQSARVTRFGPESFASNRGKGSAGFYMFAYFEATQGIDGKTTISTVTKGTSVRIMSGITTKDQQKIKQRIAQVKKHVAKALEAVKKIK